MHQPPAAKPAAVAPRPPPSAAGGRTLHSLAAPLQRGLHRIDDHLLRLLDEAHPAAARDAVRLEAALLLGLRRGLRPYVRDPQQKNAERIDGLLADTLLEAVDVALAVVLDLEADGAARYGRWLTFCRELCAELVALGDKAEAAALRGRADKLQQRLAPASANLAGLDRELGSLFAALHARLDVLSPRSAPSLLDDVLRQPAKLG